MTEPHIHVPFDRIGQHLQFIIEHRFNLEIYFSSDMLDRATPELIKQVLGLFSHRPAISIHAPFMDLSPAAVDSRILEDTRSRFNQVLDIADIMRPLSIVVHSGYEKWKYNLRIDQWLERSVETWRPLVRRAADLDLKIAVENIFEDEPTNLVSLMEEMGSESFGICFDTGHYNLFTTVTLEHWIGPLRPYIVELHLHDNHGRADEHNPIGDGSFDFAKLIRLMGDKECIRTLEAHSPERIIKSLAQYKTLFA